MRERLLSVRNLRTYYRTWHGLARAVDDVDLDVMERETVGVVGESGCGKSATALSIMRLVPSPPGEIVSGQVIFKGHDLLALPPTEMRKIRGNEISMVFQEPMTSLNPVFTIGDQLGEVLVLHRGLKGKEARDLAEHMLTLVGMADAGRRLSEYPHQLSGGMRQRVMIAMALSCNPSLLIADEPTTALDVTIQAQILELMREAKERISMAMMLITHDLGVVYEMAERVVVMYAGQVVEEGPKDDLFDKPLHPYTAGLLESIPKLHAEQKRLHVIRGSVPDALRIPEGCRFHPRCARASAECARDVPALVKTGDAGARSVRCWHVGRNALPEVIGQ